MVRGSHIGMSGGFKVLADAHTPKACAGSIPALPVRNAQPQSIKFLRHGKLAAKSTFGSCVRCEIENIFFHTRGGTHPLQPFWFHVNVARRTGTITAAIRGNAVNLVGYRYIHNILAGMDTEQFFGAIGKYENQPKHILSPHSDFCTAAIPAIASQVAECSNVPSDRYDVRKK